jgi:hypothetical protein
VGRYNLNSVKELFRSFGCELLELEYLNTKTRMRFKCKCGNIDFKSLEAFKSYSMCKGCSEDSRRSKRRLPYEAVYNEFLKNDCLLLDKEYVSNRLPLNYICSCGNTSKISLNSLREGKRCKKCGKEKNHLQTRHTLEYAKQKFKENGCVLLSNEYVNYDTPMPFICSCGNHSEIPLGSLLQGCRCKKCGIAKRSGENHPQFNPNLTDEERIINRDTNANKVWRTEVYKRDDYICRCCGKYGGRLAAHHLDGYNWCAERRTDITNGVTLCKDCHLDFHSVYGYGDNTDAQFDEWLRNKRISNEELGA